MSFDPAALPDEEPVAADPGGVPIPDHSAPGVNLADLATDEGGGMTDVSSVNKPGVDLDQMAKDAAGLLRDKMKTDADNKKISDDRIEKSRAEMQRRYAATALSQDDLKPWNQDEAAQKYKYDPIEAFGSVGSVFAVIASAFTHAPMEASMFGMASAMNAVKEGKAEEFKNAYKAWQDNGKLAIERNAIERARFEEATKLVTTDMALATQKGLETATLFGDKQKALLLENGLWKEAIDLQTARDKAAADLTKALNGNTLDSMKIMTALEHPSYADPATRSEAIKHMNQVWSGQRETDFERIHAQAIKENDGKPLSTEQELALLKKVTEAKTEVKTGGLGTPKAQEIKRRADIYEKGVQNEDGSWKVPPMDANAAYDKAADEVRTVNTALTPQNIKAAETTRLRAKYIAGEKNPDGSWKTEPMEPNAALTKASGEAISAMANPAGKIDPETVKFLADQALRGDTSVFTNLGRGAQGGENVLAVRTAIRELAAERGMTGADQALKNAEYMGLRAAERVAGSREAIISVAANEAINMMKVAEDAAAKVPRTRWVPINKLEQYIGKQASYPELAAFAQANESLVNGYVRAISPTGVPTDIVRRHAYNALQTAQGPQAYAAVLAVMRKEMDAALAAPEQVRQQLMLREKKIREGQYAPLTSAEPGGGGPVSPPPLVGGVIRYDKDGNRIP